jgi:hypothetical protein
MHETILVFANTVPIMQNNMTENKNKPEFPVSSVVLCNDILVNDGPHMVVPYYYIIILTTVLQLPTVYNRVTCCTGL